MHIANGNNFVKNGFTYLGGTQGYRRHMEKHGRRMKLLYDGFVHYIQYGQARKD